MRRRCCMEWCNRVSWVEASAIVDVMMHKIPTSPRGSCFVAKVFLCLGVLVVVCMGTLTASLARAPS